MNSVGISADETLPFVESKRDLTAWKIGENWKMVGLYTGTVLMLAIDL